MCVMAPNGGANRRNMLKVFKNIATARQTCGLIAVLMCVWMPPAGWALSPPAVIGHWPSRSPIESPLRALYAAWQRQGQGGLERAATLQALARRWHRNPLHNGAVAVELVARDASVTREWPAVAAALGLRDSVAGVSVWLSWVEPARIPELALLPGLLVARLPAVARPLTGTKLSLGATHIGATGLQCQGHAGQGVQIAVLDSDWHGLTAAIQGQELAEIAGKSPYQSANPADDHGTACAEIIADVAPGATLWLRSGDTVADLQAGVPKMAAEGVQVISMSGGWSTGWSFGDGKGKLCELVQQAQDDGLAWINAAGNEGDDQIWRGVWQDSDADGWLEFEGDAETNSFYAAHGIPVDLELDWDAYPTTDIDLDLYVCTGKQVCTQVAASKGVQDGAQTPWEVLSFEAPKSGTYYLAVRAKTPPKAGLGVRVVALDTTLGWSVSAGTLVDPASCAAAVAVGAVEAKFWDKGLAVPYSSRGPTADGRIKPDIAGPTGVVTSTEKYFDGTSAACPHVAGAVAVVMERDGLSPAAAVALLKSTALAGSAAVPNNDIGWGRIDLGAKGIGCLPESTAGACTDSCGRAGDLSCPAPCSAPVCTSDIACEPKGDAADAPDGAATVGDAGAASDATSDAPASAIQQRSASPTAGCSARATSAGGTPGCAGWLALPMVAAAWCLSRRRREHAKL